MPSGDAGDFGAIPADLGGKNGGFREILNAIPNVSMLVAGAMEMTLRNEVLSVLLRGILVRGNRDKSRPLLLPQSLLNCQISHQICISTTSFSTSSATSHDAFYCFATCLYENQEDHVSIDRSSSSIVVVDSHSSRQSVSINVEILLRQVHLL